MRIIDEELLNEVSSEAKVSPWLRMRSACRFACQRTIISTSRWRISAIGCLMQWSQGLRSPSISTQRRMSLSLSCEARLE